MQRARLPWAQKATVPDPLTVRWSRLRAAKRERPRKRALPCLKNPHQTARKYRSHPRKHPVYSKKTLFYLKNGAERGRETREAAAVWRTSTREGENQAQAGLVPLPAHTRARVTNEAIVPLQETCERL